MTQAELFAKVLVRRPLTYAVPRGYGHAKYRIIGADQGTWRNTRDARKTFFRIDAPGTASICEYGPDCLMLIVERIGGYDGPVPEEESFHRVVSALVYP